MRIKREFTGNFYLMSNSSAQDTHLSLSARGLLNTLMSFPPDFNIHVSKLCAYCEDGRDAVYSAMRKLIRVGYVYKTGQREHTVYHVDAFPHTKEEWTSLIGAKNPQTFPDNPASLCGKSPNPYADFPQSPLRKTRNDLCGKSGNNNTNNKTYNKTKEKERAAGVEEKPETQKEAGGFRSSPSPVGYFPNKAGIKRREETPVERKAPPPQENRDGYNYAPPFGYNQNQQDISARLNAIGKTWNESGALLPCRKVCFSYPEITNMLPTLQCYSDDLILQAIRNYAVIAKEPAAYCVKEDGTGITLVNFITRWVERFTDEAKPFEHYKKRNERSFGNRRYQTTPPPARNTDGADLLSKYCREI